MNSMANYKIYQVKSSAFAPKVNKGDYAYCAKERLPQVKGQEPTEQEIIAAAEYILHRVGPRPSRQGSHRKAAINIH